MLHADAAVEEKKVKTKHQNEGGTLRTGDKIKIKQTLSDRYSDSY